MTTHATIQTGAPVRRPVNVPGGRTWETRLWQFMRISGVALIPLAFGHLAIMHVINSVHDMNLCFVAARWDMLAWRLYDAALLFFALVHGLNGFRYVVDDYVHQPGLNRAIKWVVVIGGAIVFALGAIALVGGVRLQDLPRSENCV